MQGPGIANLHHIRSPTCINHLKLLDWEPVSSISQGRCLGQKNVSMFSSVIKSLSLYVNDNAMVVYSIDPFDCLDKVTDFHSNSAPAEPEQGSLPTKPRSLLVRALPKLEATNEVLLLILAHSFFHLSRASAPHRSYNIPKGAAKVKLYFNLFSI